VTEIKLATISVLHELAGNTFNVNFIHGLLVNVGEHQRKKNSIQN
jgi:hypothetical protein